MTIYRTMAILQGKSNLPEDRFVNTFHFQDDANGVTNPATVAGIQAALQQFYEEPIAVGGFSVSDFIPSDVVDGTVELRTYNLAHPEPREPAIGSFEALFSAVAPLPTEVATCISFYSERNIPRNRGRIFIGPLSTNAGSAGLAGAGMRPADAFVNTLNAAAARLMTTGHLDPTSTDWGVWSRADLAFKVVTGGWVDNAFDTQRRRGVAATTRASW